MLILAIHQTPSLTQERYEEVIRRLTGKARIEAPSDLPFDGLLVHAAGQGPNGFCVFDIFESEEAVEAFRIALGTIPKEVGIEEPPHFFRPTRRWLIGSTASSDSCGFVALKQGIHSSRLIQARAAEIAGELSQSFEFSPAERLAVQEAARCVAILEAIDRDLDQRGLVDDEGSPRYLLIAPARAVAAEDLHGGEAHRGKRT
jgi:hypothetical protein